MKNLITQNQIESKILLIRGHKVMLDRDLAELYGVTTGNLNKAVKRNKERFPENFMFQLTKNEYKSLRFRFGSLKRGEHSKYSPYAFTEHGTLMLSPWDKPWDKPMTCPWCPDVYRGKCLK